MDMGIPKARKQRLPLKDFTGRIPVLRRKIVSHVKNPSLVFHEVSMDMITGIAGDDRAFIDFHCSLPPVTGMSRYKS